MALLAFDLGGTSLRAALYDTKGVELGYWMRKTSEFESAEAAFTHAIDSLSQSHVIKKCAIGAPDIDISTGEVRAHNLSWPHFNIRKILKEKLGLEPLCFNDADLQALALASTISECASAIVFTLGTGVGMGIIEKGHVITGDYGTEGGHLYVGSERPCLCGGTGHLEGHLGGAAILSSAKALGFDAPSIGPLAELARGGNQELRALFEEVGDYLGKGIASAVSLLGIPRIILSGGVAASSDLFLEHARKSARKFIFPPYRELLQIDTGELPSDRVGLLGAYQAMKRTGRH